MENGRPRGPFRGALPDVRYVRSKFSLRINVQLIFILKYIEERNIIVTTPVRGTRLGKYVRTFYYYCSLNMAIVKEYFGSRKSLLVGRRLYLHLSRER